MAGKQVDAQGTRQLLPERPPASLSPAMGNIDRYPARLTDGRYANPASVLTKMPGRCSSDRHRPSKEKEEENGKDLGKCLTAASRSPPACGFSDLNSHIQFLRVSGHLDFPPVSMGLRAPCSNVKNDDEDDDDDNDDAWLSLLIREERREKKDASTVLLAVECLE
ncbi:hypothetical protein LZ30DRAFT_694304 [Colletotrichum cereale]|nr:hypothetical protein LZ30DRAFT_694304 [Colletotrichum cereale]